MERVASLAEVPKWGKKVVKAGETEILLVNGGGKVYAVENECPHQGSPLSGGLVKDARTLVCPRHGYRFDLETGACRDFPEYILKTYAVAVEGEDILVSVE